MCRARQEIWPRQRPNSGRLTFAAADFGPSPYYYFAFLAWAEAAELGTLAGEMPMTSSADYFVAPFASDGELIAVIADVALAEPLNGTVELAGP